MAKNRGLSLHTHISTDTTITTSPSLYYGAMAYCAGTAEAKVLVYDATSTATGTIIGGAYATGTAASQFQLNMDGNPIVCDLGIHANVTCTTAVDSIIIFWGPIS